METVSGTAAKELTLEKVEPNKRQIRDKITVKGWVAKPYG